MTHDSQPLSRPLSRRRLLRNSLVLGCSAAASPLFTPISFAAAPWDTRLVVIILRGAMDGLDVVRPVGDPVYATYRPDPDLKDQVDLDGYFAMHGRLAALEPMWKAGELAFAHAVATPYRDKRSHFDGQDLLEAGSMDLTGGPGSARGGWLNRMLTRVPGVTAETSFTVGLGEMLILQGEAPTSSWSPAGRLDMSTQGQLLLDLIYQKDPLFAEAGKAAMTLAAEINVAAMDEGEDENFMQQLAKNMQEAQKAQKAQSLAAFTAKRLNGDTRIASFSIGGWDTHASQARNINKPLGELASALTTLKAGLGQNWQKTAVLCMTEFGRTARQNGTDGTDHGTGGVMVMAGGAIRGGKVYGDWPGIGESDLYADRDLLPTRDVRSFAAWSMREMFGLAQSDLEGHIFPNLDMAGNPGFIL
jgi:uncharacterized protein (DUF1501 family)